MFFLISFILISFLINFSISNVPMECVKEGMIALTFDNGPSNYTDSILDVLKNEEVRATFHISSDNLGQTSIQQIVRRIAKEGHTTGFFAGDNVGFGKNDDSKIVDNIVRIEGIIKQLTQQEINFIRVPYGKESPMLIQKLNEHEMVITRQNLDSEDYLDDATPDSIYKKIDTILTLKGYGEGKYIMLMHDTIPIVPSTLPNLINLIRSKGYTFVTMEECLGYKEPPKTNNPPPKNNGNNNSNDQATTSDALPTSNTFYMISTLIFFGLVSTLHF